MYPTPPNPDPQLLDLLTRLIGAEGSDLHLVVGYPPTLRIHGRLQVIDQPELTPDATIRMITSIMPEDHRARLDTRRDFDFSLAIEHDDTAARFRVNVFQSRSTLGACFRHIPDHIPSFDWMGFGHNLADRITNLINGLVLVTGITGSGKSTTLAALVNHINQRGGSRILTIEEPVEYLFPKARDSIITQREVDVDVPSFAEGLRYGLRQDPDVILVGEIRDLETARMAVSAAETGHLVFSTLHTIDAKGAVTRLLDLFPRDNQDDIRTQLALSLRFVISQALLPNIDPAQKRVLALEVLTVNDGVRAGIRFGRIETLESAIQTGKKDGMISLDESLVQLVRAGVVAPAVAARHAKDPNAHPAFQRIR